jgi:hypothetical protein
LVSGRFVRDNWDNRDNLILGHLIWQGNI